MCCVLLLSGRSLLVNSSMTHPMTLVVTSGLWALQPLSWEMETLPSLKCILWKCSLRSQGRTPGGALDSPVLCEPGRKGSSLVCNFSPNLRKPDCEICFLFKKKRKNRLGRTQGGDVSARSHPPRNGTSLEQLSTYSATNFPRCSFCALHARNTDAV